MGSPITTQMFSKHFKKLTLEFLGAEFGITAFQHIYIGLLRDHMGMEMEADIDNGEHPYTSQSAHTGRTQQLRYAVHDDDWTLMSYDSIQKYVDASQKLHTWLENDSEGQPTNKEFETHKTLEAQVAMLTAKVDEMTSEMKEKKQSFSNLSEMLAKLIQEK
ncbi:hypothetical protein FRC11_013738 [Ceratobasidium sp. 423]|nr:hypothetical protein FRC11_013738 [Ceratobasidium sp. 423]